MNIRAPFYYLSAVCYQGIPLMLCQHRLIFCWLNYFGDPKFLVQSKFWPADSLVFRFSAIVLTRSIPSIQLHLILVMLHKHPFPKRRCCIVLPSGSFLKSNISIDSSLSNLLFIALTSIAQRLPLQDSGVSCCDLVVFSILSSIRSLSLPSQLLGG